MAFSISGLAGSGKDTFADILCGQYGYHKDHFAFDLKNISLVHFAWDGEKDAKGRHLLQQLGTEVGRAYCKNIWLIKFCQRNGLKIPGNETLPGDDHSYAEKQALGHYWLVHGPDASVSETGFSVHVAPKRVPPVMLAKIAFDLKYWLVKKFPRLRPTLFRVEDQTSKTKARLLALAELGWTGHYDLQGLGGTLIDRVEKLGANYAPYPWYTRPADFAAFKAILRASQSHSAANTDARTDVPEDVPADVSLRLVATTPSVGTGEGNNRGQEPNWSEHSRGRPFEKLIVPDCRFPNELDVLVDNLFFSVQVVRPDVVKMGHESETALEGRSFHVRVNNSGTLDDLHAKARRLILMLENGELAAAVQSGTAVEL